MTKAFSRSSKKMSSIAFVFFITTARTWSRCYPTSIEKEGTIRSRTSGNYSRVVDLEILIHFKLLFFKCEHVSSVNGAKACSPWRNSNWNAENVSKIYLWKFVALSVLTERIWVIQTSNHHDWRNRRIAKEEEQDFCWNDTKKESSISFGRIILVKSVWHVALKLPQVGHNVMPLNNCSDPAHIKKKTRIWFTRTILSIALVWTRILISLQIGEGFSVRFNEVPLFYHSLPEGRSHST